MNKDNKNNTKTIVPLIYELTNSPTFDKIKVDIIKEAIKNNEYHINSKNIAKQFLEFSSEYLQELDATI
jgi:anti-sigma28 factor (negative regulator of flagellin synthesis)